jgi:hypothetical protein
MKACFNRKNKPIAKIIHTAEKIKARSVWRTSKLERMLDRVQIDRSILIDEKLRYIMGGNTKQPDAPGLKQVE